MTERKAVAAVTRDTASLEQTRRYLANASDLSGMISQDQTAAPDGVVQSTGSLELIQQVCRVLIEMDINPEDGGHYSKVQKALKKASIPTAVYEQVASQPDFIPEFMRLTNVYVDMPRYVAVKKALSASAMQGDIPAAKAFLSGVADVGARIEDAVRQYEHMGQEGLMKEVGRLIDDLKIMMAEANPRDADPALIAESVEAVAAPPPLTDVSSEFDGELDLGPEPGEDIG